MKNKNKEFAAGISCLSAFVVWTILIQTVDVQVVGVNGTTVGLAAINTWFHKLTVSIWRSMLSPIGLDSYQY